jgi:hypothetical protein
MQLCDERLALVRSDIALLRERLDQIAQQPDHEHARHFLYRELLSSQQIYHALIKNRLRQLHATAVGP